MANRPIKAVLDNFGTMITKLRSEHSRIGEHHLIHKDVDFGKLRSGTCPTCSGTGHGADPKSYSAMKNYIYQRVSELSRLLPQEEQVIVSLFNMEIRDPSQYLEMLLAETPKEIADILVRFNIIDKGIVNSILKAKRESMLARINYRFKNVDIRLLTYDF
jgi:hypothetical protein